MKHGFGTYSLMLSVVLYGVLLGGVVYAHLVFFPVYLGHLPESAAVVNGEYPIRESIFWLTIHPLLILSLTVSLIANWKGTRRKLIAMTLSWYIVVLVISALYFIPQLGEFEKSQKSQPSAEWVERGHMWQRLSWLRGASLFVFSMPLLFALAKPKDETR